MTANFLRRVLLVSVILLVPALASAQEAMFTGTVSDATGGVLPGVVITAVHEASGNMFTATTDERGEFRLPVPPSGLQESVTVTGEAPLVDTTTSTVGANIDPRQMQEL